MIRGVHTMFYSSAPTELRAFFRDTMGFTASDVGEGWLIFDLPEADLGVHPTDGHNSGNDNPPSGTHAISFYCDDIQRTVAAMKKKGVEFTQDIQNQGFGLVTHFKVPGGFAIQLYQPLYTKGKAKTTKAAKTQSASAKKRTSTQPKTASKAKATPQARSKPKKSR